MKTIEALRKLQLETKAEVFLVGGFVRDLLRKKQSVDLDVVVRKLTVKRISTFLKKHGSVKKVTLSDIGNDIKITHLIFKANGDDIEAQIGLPKRGAKHIPSINNTLKQDVLCRDFTINGMYLPINYKSRKDIIDLVDGRKDLSSRRIVSILKPKECFINSPIRMMRAVSLAARTGYSIDAEVMQAIAEEAGLLFETPIENIREEFNKILLSKKPSISLKLMNKLRLLHVFFPELENCNGVSQNIDYHKYNVFQHCVYACDNADPDLVLRLSALLHDVGKANVAEIKKGHVTFHKHELWSEKLAGRFLRRLKYSNDIINNVLHLVRNHMYHYVSDVHVCSNKECTWRRHVDPSSDNPQRYTKCPTCTALVDLKIGWSDGAVRRWIRKMGLTEEDFANLENIPLFKLRIADRLGSGFKTIPVTARQKDFEARLQRLYKESKAIDIKDLDVRGEDLLSLFNLKPSPIIGEILAHLLSKVLESPEMNNRRTLLVETTKYLCDKKM